MSKPKHREDVMEREVGDEKMIYDPAHKNVHVISETAFFVWQRCDGQHSVEDIAAEAAAKYGAAAEEVRPDIEKCLAQFRELSLLES